MSKKSKAFSNTEEGTKEALASIQEKIDKREMVCYQTDKSGRWSCDDPENYKLACKKHLQDNTNIESITETQHNDNEKEINAHAAALLNMMGLEENSSSDRIRRAMKSEGNPIAPFYSTRKDHKPVVEGKEKEGPKTRPVCGAKSCHTKRLAYMLGEILKPLTWDEETECDCTEDLLAEVERVNTQNVNPEWVVGSLDVEALYPSLDVDECAKVVGETLYNSKITVEHLQWKDIALYLKYNATEEQLRRYKVKSFLPKRKTTRGHPPTFTGSGCKKKEKKSDSSRGPIGRSHPIKKEYGRCFA